MEQTLTNFPSTAGYLAQDADDQRAIAKCLAGDTAAFEVIVTRYQRVLFTVAFRMLGDYDEANDAAQNAFVNAYRKLQTYDAGRRFFSWLYRILVNECLNERRDRRAHEPITPDMATVGSAADLFEADERRRSIQAAIQALPNDYRQVIVLRHFTELSYEQIAEVLGVPTKTVKSRLFTARERLGHQLRNLDGRR
jgi:RNA polymerase sigma-70 factor (ECF subfamily)